MHEASDGQGKEGQQAVRPTGAGTAGAAAAAASDWLGRIKPDDKEELRQVWEHLKETVEALPHVGCYSIASVAYRRQAQSLCGAVLQCIVCGCTNQVGLQRLLFVYGVRRPGVSSYIAIVLTLHATL